MWQPIITNHELFSVCNSFDKIKDLGTKCAPTFPKKKKKKLNKNKAMHKTRLSQNNKSKHTSNANKNKKRREKK